MGVRIGFICLLLWIEVRFRTALHSGTDFPSAPCTRYSRQSRKRATLVSPHFFGNVVGTDAQVTLIALVLVAAGARPVLFPGLRRLGRFLRLRVATVDLCASIGVFHSWSPQRNDGAMNAAWAMPAASSRPARVPLAGRDCVKEVTAPGRSGAVSLRGPSKPVIGAVT
jgi:hypothetical protein